MIRCLDGGGGSPSVCDCGFVNQDFYGGVFRFIDCSYRVTLHRILDLWASVWAPDFFKVTILYPFSFPYCRLEGLSFTIVLCFFFSFHIHVKMPIVSQEKLASLQNSADDVRNVSSSTRHRDFILTELRYRSVSWPMLTMARRP